MAYRYQSGLTIPEPMSFSPMRVDPGQAFSGDQGASQLLGQLHRAQWEDWKKRFAPYIGALADATTDPDAPGMAAANASAAMGLAFDNSAEALQMRRQGMGIAPTAAQQQFTERSQNLGRAAAKVSAGNQARISALDRQNAILAGGMGLSNIPGRVLNQ